MGYLKSGDSVIVWGQVTRDASCKEFDSGAKVVNFSVKYGYEDRLYGDGGTGKGKYMDVKCWWSDFYPDIFNLCSCLERGDRVLVAGKLTLDRKPDRDGNDRWYLDPEFVSVQQTVQVDDGAAYDEDEPEPEEEAPPREFAEEDYPEVLRNDP